MPRGSLWPESLRIKVVARAERDELALKLVAAGLGIVIAPQSLATEDVVARSVDELDAARSIGIAWRGDLDADILAAVLEALASIN
jgi:DNA-binding transcriptional LysR family regulator